MCIASRMCMVVIKKDLKYMSAYNLSIKHRNSDLPHPDWSRRIEDLDSVFSAGKFEHV